MKAIAEMDENTMPCPACGKDLGLPEEFLNAAHKIRVEVDNFAATVRKDFVENDLKPLISKAAHGGVLFIFFNDALDHQEGYIGFYHDQKGNRQRVLLDSFYGRIFMKKLRPEIVLDSFDR